MERVLGGGGGRRFNRHEAWNHYHTELVNWVKISDIEFHVVLTNKFNVKS